MLIVSYRGKHTRAFAEGDRVKTFRVWGAGRATARLLQFGHVCGLGFDLSGNRLEALQRDRKWQYRARIDNRWRIVRVAETGHRAPATLRSWIMTSRSACNALHPGEHLAEQLEALDISAAELGRQLRVPGNRISQILTGHRGITGDTALRLGHFFGTSPQFWLNLQVTYDLLVAEQKSGTIIKGLPTLTARQKRTVDAHVPAM